MADVYKAALFASSLVESFPPDMMILRVDGQAQERLNPFDKHQQFSIVTKIEKKGTPDVQGSSKWGSDAITSVTTNPSLGSVTTDRRYLQDEGRTLVIESRSVNQGSGSDTGVARMFHTLVELA